MDKTPEGIDASSVTQWMVDTIANFEPPLKFELIAGGHSNLTYRVTDKNQRAFVLRRPPLGHVLQSAHDMAREHKIISAIAKSSVPVAPALALCEDETINGSPFYVMNFVDGLVLHSQRDVINLPLTARDQLSEQVINNLVELHLLSPDTVGLGQLGKRDGYLERQLKRWSQQWEKTKTHEIPDMDRVVQQLTDRMPAQIGACIVHGDYRLGNMIVTEQSGNAKVAAILDWELCALGDPLADLGYLLNQWPSPNEAGNDESPTRSGGFLSRDQLCDIYQTRTGRDLSSINYYRAFSWWRLAAIGQGVYKRYLAGAMGHDRAVNLDTMKENVANRARTALALIDR